MVKCIQLGVKLGKIRWPSYGVTWLKHVPITQDDVAIQTNWSGMGPMVYGGIFNMMAGV
jgi:hypothetical protein